MPFRKKRKMRPHGAVALLKTRALRIEFATTRRRLVELEAVLAAAHGAYQKHTAIAAKDGSVERSTAYFHRVADFLDLLLEPNEADEAIGNLEELYIRRFATNPPPRPSVAFRTGGLDRFRSRHGHVASLYEGARGEMR
jgi:hypothetical protein